MRKNSNLYEEFITAISPQIKRAIRQGNYLIEDSLSKAEDDNYEYEISFSSTCEKPSKSVFDSIQNASVSTKNGKIIVKCKDFDSVEDFISLIKKDFPSKTTTYKKDSDEIVEFLPITINKLSKQSALDDSLNESAEENTTESGEFITDFIYSPDEDLVNKMDEATAAKLHVKNLIKYGMKVDIVQKRYSTQLIIHYYNNKQYEELLKWYAWHRGETEFAYVEVPRKLRSQLEKIVKSGKETTW